MITIQEVKDALERYNEHDSVVIANIVFLQGDDYNQMESELNESDNPESSAWLSDDKVVEYLLQWYYNEDPDYPTNAYNLDDINTPFLGNLRTIMGVAWLYTLNTHMGYAGLSKIIELQLSE